MTEKLLATSVLWMILYFDILLLEQHWYSHFKSVCPLKIVKKESNTLKEMYM